MNERVKADGNACTFCAARTLTDEGSICEPWKLGPSNNNSRKHKRFKFGVTHKSGTTMRPRNCPHPENKVSNTPSAQSLLTKLLRK